MQRRRLFAGFVAARSTMIQNWCALHVCGEAYWIAYYYYFISISFSFSLFSNIWFYIKEGTVCCYFSLPLSLPFD